MPNDVRQKFNECTDVSYLEKELVPFIAPQTMQRGNQVKVKIQFTLTRGPVSRFIGAICETCAIEPIDHHPNMAFVTFSQPATNEMYVNSFMGGCVLIETRTKTGERALVLRGINPQLRLLNKVDTGDFYRTFLHYVVEHVAGPLGIKQILAPYETLSGQGFSNRPLIHLLFKHHHRDNHHIVELDENYGTRYNDRDIHDKCIRIWSASQAPH